MSCQLWYFSPIGLEAAWAPYNWHCRKEKYSCPCHKYNTGYPVYSQQLCETDMSWKNLNSYSFIFTC
jgi:hypothetical protein